MHAAASSAHRPWHGREGGKEARRGAAREVCDDHLVPLPVLQLELLEQRVQIILAGLQSVRSMLC